MTSVTVLSMSKDDLATMLAEAVSKAVEAAAERSHEMWTAGDLARHYGVTTRTIATWYRHPGRLPPKCGSRWKRGDVIRWDRERGNAS